MRPHLTLAALCLALSLPATAGSLRDAEPFLGRWDMTLHTPERDYSSWLDIDGDGPLRVRMVGRWGHARWVKQVELADGRLKFTSPHEEEGRSDDMVFEGESKGDELVGTTTGPKGELWTWRAERAPSLRRSAVRGEKPPVPLFAGQDAGRWELDAAAAKTWHVADGELISEGMGSDLHTRERFRDFKLHVEFNCAPEANSGVYLRGRYEVQIETESRNSIANQQTGGVYGFIAPAAPAPRTPGLWHAYDITLVGRNVTVVLDGAVLIDHEDIPGTTGGALDSHERLPGPIVLQGSEPGRVAFRNIVLTPLNTADRDSEASPRVRGLLTQMSREEKLAVIRGAHEPENVTQGQAGWTRGVPRLGVPDLRFADGPPGVLVRHASTGMPATLSMAATFSREDAKATGALIGRDARTLGIDVILQPYINLYRDPTFERAYNTLGEDPLLTGTLAAQFVEGAQAQNVMSQAKHFVAYEGGDDVAADGRTLRELYIAPFRQVSRAGVSSIMCSYNRIGGIYSCGNGRLLNGILRDEEGFAGFVTSDWGAAHGAEFIRQGMDMEQPGTGPDAFFALGEEPAEKGQNAAELEDLDAVMSIGVPEEQGHPLPKPAPTGESPPPGVKNLGEALKRGIVNDQDLDRAVLRVLSQMERFGWLEHAPDHVVHAQPVEANARHIQKLAERGAVLLKNDGVLPLSGSDLASLALIGPGALQSFAIVNGQEQSYGRAEREIGAYQALKAQGLGKGVRTAVADDMSGVPIPPKAFSGLTRSSTGEAGQVADSQIDFTNKSARSLPSGTHASWSGNLFIAEAGDYDIDLQLLGATGKFFIDDKKVGDMGWWGGHGDIVFANRDNVIPTTDGLDNVRRLVHLSAGEHRLRVEAHADGSGGPVQVRLAWVTPAMRTENFQATVELAGRSKVAVVFAWSRNRPYFGLPGDQNRLIAAVAAVNPNTVVVLNTGQAVAMPWLDKVRAVLEMWYTGDEGGWAAANLLTGRANPGGKLPISWPKRFEDYAVMDPPHPERVGHGVLGKTAYDEGIFMGYRWFDHEKTEPLFAFGHGLSYSSFTYSDLRLSRSQDGGVTLTCRVTNTSARAGDAVVQAYLGAPDPVPAGVQFADRALADFTRISVPAGGSRNVRMHLAAEGLQYWSLEDHAWHVARVGRTVYVGSSSRDLPLSAQLPAPQVRPTP